MADRIRILFAIDSLVRGGTELQLAGLIARLDRNRYEPWLLTIRPMEQGLVPPDCHHLQWNVPRLASRQGITALARLTRLLRRYRITVVQTYFQDSTLFAGLAAWVARTPVRIACFRDMGFWSGKTQDKLLGFAYRRLHGYIANAVVVREHFVKHFNLPREKFEIIHNGVDVAALTYVAHAGRVSDVGIVGNMTRHVKRIDLFIRAAAIVGRTHPEIRWHVIGEGHLRGELENLARVLGIHRQMIFAGRVSDVAAYLEELQIGVICSDSEGLSNAVIEYMFKGVAVVATSVGGNAELVQEGVTESLVPPGDEHALAAAIRYLVEAPAERFEMAAAARSAAQHRYSWEQCIEGHDALYAQLISVNSGGLRA